MKAAFTMSSSTPPDPQENPSAQAETLAQHAQSIRHLSKRAIADVIEIGRRLRECKTLLGHGNWLRWIGQEFGWSERTARNFISAYEFARSRSANLADLALDVSSLYLLAAPSTPQEARDEILRRASSGDILSHAETKQIVGAYGPTTVPAKSPVSVQRAIDEGPLADFSKLPRLERAKIRVLRPKHLHQAIIEAAIRQQWAPPYRELQDALNACEKLRRRSVRKILAAIPAGDFEPTMERLERAIESLEELGNKTDTPKKRKPVRRSNRGAPWHC